ncbi:uncharacterized protein LOC132560402 [Ylistrum balloti]|uniref:uncharacterized protein LOC132560402 n=1 Tax=Ylistrum balloti TaxID=509963 RepID=UPI002905B25F|nr:uncharacterized protein LOC132560402 [Ylistrum balloti]
MSGLQKSGYLQVKQPSNIKGRKLKTWRMKWAILHKMSNISEGTFAAKLDLYPDESSAAKSSQDKLTYIFENVSCIQSANSKTHKCAFEIVETYPVICLASLVDAETVEWAKAFQYIFWPPPGPDGKDLFQVIIEENEDSRKYSLSGEYWMILSPQELKIKAMSKAQMLSWKLCNLKRFNLDQRNSKILIIESGAKSDFGEAKFMFRSSNVLDIFQCIRKNIARAVEARQRKFSAGSLEGRGRTSSASNSEKGYKMLLERSREDLNGSIDSIDSLSETSDSTKLRTKSQESLQDSVSLETSPPPKPPRLLPKLEPTGDNDLTSCYDELALPSAPKVDVKKESPQIVSTEVIHDKENQRFVEVNHDSYGYSHVQCPIPQDSRVNIVRSVSGYDDVDLSPTSEKNKNIPNRLDHNQDLRSGSVKSNDSGFVPCDASDSPVRQTVIGLKANHRNNSSFDSAISTSSCVESISAAVNDVLIVTELSTGNKTYDNIDSAVADDHGEIYSDIHSHPKHDSHVNDETETQYEDLEKYRKDLNKYLGMDPRVNPGDVPPSLPDRPTSLPIRRKEFKKKTKKSKSSSRKVTFSRFLRERNSTHSRTASVTSTSSSSSVSDGEDDSPLPKIPTFQMLKHMQKNTLYEQTSVKNDHAIDVAVSPMKEDTVPRRHSVDSVLVGASQRRSVARSSDYDEVQKEPKKTVSFDLLTGELLDDSVVTTSGHSDSDILSPISPKTPCFPPTVEMLVAIDLPENKSHEIVIDSAKGTSEDQLVFHAKPDGNFVWDPFPKMTKYDRPLIDFESNQDLSDSSENKSTLSPVTLDTTCYEIMASIKKVNSSDNFDSVDLSNIDPVNSPITTSTPNSKFVDNMDPFNIFSQEPSAVNSLHNKTHSSEVLVDSNSDVIKSNEEPAYMDMTRAVPPVEDEYVAPSMV